jgi:hypothetical protein
MTRAELLVDLEQPAPGIAVPCPDGIDYSSGLTVEAWIDVRESRAEAWQEIVGQWEPLEQWGQFDAYDAGFTSGLETTGFFGAVFDGRYVYFVPQHDSNTRHGTVLRYDTHTEFKNSSAWTGFDAGHTDGLETKGYYGAVFDGRYVYFVPRRTAESFHSRVLRLDTQGEFQNPDSWSAYDAGLERSYQSAAFDGRYIYFTPGHVAVHKSEIDDPDACASPPVTGMDPDYVLLGNSIVLRHDTQGDFKDPSSWTTFDAAETSGLNTCDYDGAVFDGRFVYFMPLSTGVVLRYDTRSPFEAASSWSAFDANPLGLKLAVGGVFDGRYLYITPYGETDTAVRYDTRNEFTDAESWQSYATSKTPKLETTGFDGAAFDGRFVYYIPYYDGGTFFHGRTLRYDTRGDFENPESWSCRDAGKTDGLTTVGFNGGAFDGRFLYYAAWIDGDCEPGKTLVGNGRVLRYDTLGARGSFSLRYADCGHNGGLNASVPGPRFIVNTERGARSAAAHRTPESGRHHLVGTYDGEEVRIYLDGECVGRQEGGGRIVASETPLIVADKSFLGSVERISITGAARDADWVKERFLNIEH